MEGRSAAEIVAKWPVTKIATMSFDYAYGQDVTKAFIKHLKKLKPSAEIVDQQWPKLGEQDYNPFINAQMAKKPEAIFSSIWGGFFVTYSKQAKAVGMFDAVKYNFIGVGEAATPETTKSMGADYPVGIWGNSYDAFYWGETAAHRDYTARLSKYLKDEYPSSWAIQGYIGMQFLAEAIKKAGSTDSDKVAKALLGLTVETPIGPQTIREKDHQANRGQLYGKTVKDPKYPFAIMKPVTYVDPTKFMDYPLPDPSFVFAQSVSGLTAAMFLFLIAAGLSLIFGVLRVLNFAHGTFYMLGAYATFQLVQWLGVSGGRFWLTALGGALFVAALGGLVERLLFRHLYGKEELYQLLFTYALALILGDAAKMLWGTQQKSVSRPPELSSAFQVFGATIPTYNLFIILLGPAIALAFWLVLQRTRVGRYIRAAALDRETLGALGVNVDALYTGVFVLASFLGGLGGALISPMRATTPGMDTEIIVEAFVVVVIGGLGSFWGTFLGALIYGQVLSFGILFFPRFSIFAVFALMAAVLIVRPWGLLGRPIR